MFNWSLNADSGLYAWSLIFSAWLLERLLPISSAIDPIAFFRFVCTRMAIKVLPAEKQSQQHYISGVLAIVVLVIPIGLIVYLISQFASYQWLFNLIVLYLALQLSGQLHLVKKIADAVKRNKKQLARDLLSTQVLRDTSALSMVGISKASIEMISLRISFQHATTLALALLLSPLFALCYRLCYEAAQTWNVKLNRYARFGYFSSRLCFVLQWLPTRFYALLLVLINFPANGLNALKACFTRQSLLSCNANIIYAAVSGVLNTHVSGAIRYEQSLNQEKNQNVNHQTKSNQDQISETITVRRHKYFGRDEPAASDIFRIVNAHNRTMLVYLMFLLFISFAVNANV
uniref:cobalamin biosynthesis protein CobD/CbiB n=1 Tax=Ningiella ruwaisensis TaxID=2364274 RepID=UPI001448183F|nr:cobalamin biosynthesis protein [Ningiella ruwaisensis]